MAVAVITGSSDAIARLDVLTGKPLDLTDLDEPRRGDHLAELVAAGER